MAFSPLSLRGGLGGGEGQVREKQFLLPFNLTDKSETPNSSVFAQGSKGDLTLAGNTQWVSTRELQNCALDLAGLLLHHDPFLGASLLG